MLQPGRHQPLDAKQEPAGSSLAPGGTLLCPPQARPTHRSSISSSPQLGRVLQGMCQQAEDGFGGFADHQEGVLSTARVGKAGRKGAETGRDGEQAGGSFSISASLCTPARAEP